MHTLAKKSCFSRLFDSHPPDYFGSLVWHIVHWSTTWPNQSFSTHIHDLYAWFVCSVWSPFPQVHHVYCIEWPDPNISWIHRGAQLPIGTFRPSRYLMNTHCSYMTKTILFASWLNLSFGVPGRPTMDSIWHGMWHHIVISLGILGRHHGKQFLKMDVLKFHDFFHDCGLFNNSIIFPGLEKAFFLGFLWFCRLLETLVN